jgi:hypothetical protein
VARVLVTGMSGAGRTTVLDELRRRGFLTVDTYYGGWELPDGTSDEPRMGELLARHSDLVVSGTVENQGRFYDRSTTSFLLSAPLEVLLQRVSHRTKPYGRTPNSGRRSPSMSGPVEPLLRLGATTELDGRRAISEPADAVESWSGRRIDLPQIKRTQRLSASSRAHAGCPTRGRGWPGWRR